MLRAMRVPLLFGTRKGVERSGDKFRGECPKCGSTGAFYAAKKTFNVNVLVTVSLWDSAEDVVQCGECLATFEPDAIPRLPEEPKVSLTDRVKRALGALGVKGDEPAPAAPPDEPAASPARSEERSRDVSAEIDAELAAMKRRLKK